MVLIAILPKQHCVDGDGASVGIAMFLSIGQCATPSRVLKGVRLPGHMGCDRVTVKNLDVVRVDEDLNIIVVKGAVPGGKNGIVRVRVAGNGNW